MIAPFVDAGFLEQHLSEVVLADVRWYLDGRLGRDAYDAGHIAGAIFVDLERQLVAGGDIRQGRHPLPTPEQFASALGELGIRDSDTVIAYDDAGGVIAARLVWMLRVTGREAALLDGGIQAWPHPRSTEPTQRPPSNAEVRPWPAGLLAGIDEVAAGGGLLIDARPRERFRGDQEDPVDPQPGHIPGAVSVPAREHLDDSGRLLPVADLHAVFTEAGIERGEEVVSYCGSGVTACHNLLALEHAGLGLGRLYPGSYSQWSRDPTRPIEVGIGEPPTRR
jgi:thiosulfate/3-mercaptopyruvate sulfurtransferase